MEWRVAEAKNRFSELLDKAETEGPQRLRRRGKLFVVTEVIETSEPVGPNPVVELLRSLDWDDLEFPRAKGTMREIDL